MTNAEIVNLTHDHLVNVYGCTPNNMAKGDEWIAIDEYLHVLCTHVLAAATYLA